MNEINREYEQKESLIQQAKAEYTKKTMPQQSKTDGGEGMSHVFSSSSVEDRESAPGVCGQPADSHCDYSHIGSGRQEFRFGGISDDEDGG